jgi:hypothetical protein
VGFEVCDNADGENRMPCRVGFVQFAHDFQGHEMRAKDSLGPEFRQLPHKPAGGHLGQHSAGACQFACESGVVCPLKEMRPQIRRVFDEFYVALDVNFPVENRSEFQDVETPESVLGAARAPGFFERGSGLHVASASRDRSNKDTHRRSGRGRKLPERLQGSYRADGSGLRRMERRYRCTLAPPPFISFSTSPLSAIEVSPGVVIASAPCAAPYSTAF